MRISLCFCLLLSLLCAARIHAQPTVTIITGGTSGYLVSPNLFWKFGLCKYSLTTEDRIPCISNGRVVSQFIVVGKRASDCPSGAYGVDILEKLNGLTVTRDFINATLTLDRPRVEFDQPPATAVRFAAGNPLVELVAATSKMVAGLIIDNDGVLQLLESHTGNHIGWNEGANGRDVFDRWMQLGGANVACGLSIIKTTASLKLNATFQGNYLYNQRGNISESDSKILDSVYNSGQSTIEYSRAVVQTRSIRSQYKASSSSGQTYGLGLSVGFSYEFDALLYSTEFSTSVTASFENSVLSTKTSEVSKETLTTTVVNLAVDIPPGVTMNLYQDQVYIKQNYGSNNVLTYCYPDWNMCSWINQTVAPPIDIMVSFPQFRFTMD